MSVCVLKVKCFVDNYLLLLYENKKLVLSSILMYVAAAILNKIHTFTFHLCVTNKKKIKNTKKQENTSIENSSHEKFFINNKK